MNRFQSLERRYSLWLTRPAKNAAGRMGLYRIVYSLFYLWFLAQLRFTELSLVPTSQWRPTILFSGLSPLPGAAYPAMEILLVISLVLQLIGYKTRIANLMVLIMGFALAVFRTGLLVEDRTLVVTVFYVPLFMLFSNWGATYSIDALLRQQQGQPVVDPKTSSWHYIWPTRGLMVILSMLFLSAVIEKLISLDWLVNPRFVGDFLLVKGVSSYLSNGFPVSPLGPKLGQLDAFIIPAQYVILLFEAAFVLVLFSRIAQALIFRLAPIFHSFNTLLLGIPFISVLSIYAAFPDWQTLYERFYPQLLKIRGLAKLPSPLLSLGSVGLAVLVGLLWNTTPIPRQIFGLFGIFSYHTLWFGLLPFVVLWILSPLWQRDKNHPSLSIHERL
ncbi:hypothetical protein IQ260_06850 [Leptolyngbya cf. ectocarpi LEGE 11479]|uniref:HTTM domain-containing protein n=1 Tax=Leptolyngbya cf. ectocarpi LEGE 11479 TaxID=1828722 RepID=A0A928WZV2_LEPEC|nr:hypothetical protein [Leptolyngbya ectocarpi]MBE9066367.1 hypothetical protein [Leptolyngbya cf. ectocarpi LEGE 11479]